jgi:pyridoxamine 5'-phosphate oxidase
MSNAPSRGASLLEPFDLFTELLGAAREVGADRLPEPTAFALATVGASGQPSVRILLLKGVDARGFVFYTNYESRKGGELLAHPRAAMCFHWQPLERQVRVEGEAEPVSAEEADAYFATRPRGSQLGAWASHQTAVIHGRGDLEHRFHELETTYRGRPVPRPPHWGGYRVIPVEIEFWQGRPDRLHDRFVYRLREPKDWIIERLSP